MIHQQSHDDDVDATNVLHRGKQCTALSIINCDVHYTGIESRQQMDAVVFVRVTSFFVSADRGGDIQFW